MAGRYERTTDFSSAEANNETGRSTVNTAALDGELDTISDIVNAHANSLDQFLRSDGVMTDNFLQGHEFSDAAITYLATVVGGSEGTIGPAGPIGPQGPIGPTGATGATGPSGTSINLLGSVADFASLPAGTTAGEAYITIDDGHLAVYDGADWQDVGAFTGPQGDTGPQGPQGIQGEPGVAGDTFPTQTGNANKVLVTDGASVSWQTITSAMIDTSVAKTASPTFTGTVNAAALTLSGTLNAGGAASSIGTYGQPGSALAIYGYIITSPKVYAPNPLTASLSISLASGHIGTAQVGNYDITVTAGAMGPGRAHELLITSHATVDRLVTFPAGWTWMGYKPPSFLAGKKGLLAIRCYGTEETDVVASWVES